MDDNTLKNLIDALVEDKKSDAKTDKSSKTIEEIDREKLDKKFSKKKKDTLN